MIRLYESMTRIRTQADRMAGITRKPMRITRYETGDYMEGRKIVDIDKAAGEGHPRHQKNNRSGGWPRTGPAGAKDGVF
ncbi:MAG: hypothetical protein SWC96_13550 [Thermodesulfobacteriota bacterium]|nr:hypothetical protein [Thermodesulfobacteriota bacterium]